MDAGSEPTSVSDEWPGVLAPAPARSTRTMDPPAARMARASFAKRTSSNTTAASLRDWRAADHFGSRWGFEPLGPFGALKSTLDGHLAQVAPWTIHHIRHTARSLLSKVMRPDIAELCLGHALRGMRKVYDHHLYEKEKLAALEGLATLVLDIVK